MIGHDPSGEQVVLSGLALWETVGICPGESCLSGTSNDGGGVLRPRKWMEPKTYTRLEVYSAEAHTRNLGVRVGVRVGYTQDTQYHFDADLIDAATMLNKSTQTVRRDFIRPFLLQSSDDLLVL